MNTNPVKPDDLRGMAAFQHMTPAHIEALAARMVRRAYAPGQLIFLEGDSSIGVWFIASGRVKIIKQSTSGRLQGLCMVDSGKCFGSCPLFIDRNPADAQALDEVTLFVLPREDFNRLIREDPELAGGLLQVYSQRLAHLAKLGESLGAWTVGARINDCLLAYATYTEPHPVIELTHEKLSILAGTAREVVTRHLSKLEKDGIIRIESGQITLLNLDAIETPCLAAQQDDHESAG